MANTNVKSNVTQSIKYRVDRNKITAKRKTESKGADFSLGYQFLIEHDNREMEINFYGYRGDDNTFVIDDIETHQIVLEILNGVEFDYIDFGLIGLENDPDFANELFDIIHECLFDLID